MTVVATASGPSTISLHDNNTSYGMNDFGLDDIVLSSNVPEPASAILLALGSIATLHRRRG